MAADDLPLNGRIQARWIEAGNRRERASLLCKLPAVVQFTLCWWLLSCFFCSLAVKFVVWCSGSCFKSGALLSPFGAGTLEDTNSAVFINPVLRVGLKVKVLNCF